MSAPLIKARFFRLRALAVWLAVLAVAHLARAVDNELWVGPAPDPFWSDPNNWSGASQNPNNNNVFFGNGAVMLLGNVTNVVDISTNCYSLNYTNTLGYYTTAINAIGPVQTLTIDGNNNGRALNMNPSGQTSNTNIIEDFMGQPGTLLITTNGSGAIAAGGVFVSSTNCSAAGVAPVLDMSGLATFIISNADSAAAIQVGYGAVRCDGILNLAITNYLMLPTNGTGAGSAIVLGYNSSNNGGSPGGVLNLGLTNSIFADSIAVGLYRQSAATLCFNPVFTSYPYGVSPNPVAAVYIRGYSGTAVKNWAISDGLTSAATSATTGGTVDFNGGMVNAVVNNMWIGRTDSGSTVLPTSTGTLSFSGGTITVVNLTNAIMTQANSSTLTNTAIGIITVTETGTLVVSNLVMAVSRSTIGTNTCYGTLNITYGGTVAAGTISSGGGTNIISVNAGTLTVVNTAGTTAAPLTALNLTNASLNLSVNPAANATNIVATTVGTNGTTTITINSISGPLTNATYPLIKYTGDDPYASLTLNPVLPAGYTNGSLVNDTAKQTIDLMVVTFTANAGPNQTNCSGSPVVIGGSPTASGGSGSYTYSWSPATGLSATNVANPTASPTSTTTYTVTVTDTSSTSNAQSSVTVTVNPLPTVSVTSATIDAGKSATLTATNSASSPGYLWNPGGATTASITVSPASTTTYMVTVTDGTTGCTNNNSGTVTIIPSPTLTTSSLPNGTVNTSYSQTLMVSGGTAPFTWTLVNGSLPPGLILNSSTGGISGTPTNAGFYSFTVQVSDQFSETATESFTVIVAVSPTTITATNRYAYGANIGWMDWYGNGANGAVIGVNVCSGFIYSGNVGWINLGSGSPTNGVYYQNLSANDFGVNLDGSGNLTGYAYGANIGWITFTNTGAPKVDLVTGNLSGYAWSANCGWISLSNAVAYVQTVSPYPMITTASLSDATENTLYSQTLAESAGTAPFTWTLANGSLPPGLTLSTNGVLSGTPTAAGTASFTVKVTGGNGASGTQSFNLIVNPPPTITAGSLPNGAVYTGYNQMLAASGGTGTLRWALAGGSLPAGMSLSSGGIISGTPTTAGTYFFTVQVTDANGASATQPFTLIINPPAPTTITITNRYAYGANIGWMDWRGDTNNGAVIGTNVCSGFIYCGNVGWINLGSGSPTNGIYYQNLSPNDFGVNMDSQGNLRGYAWGANIGWITFTNTGAPQVSLLTGNFSGYAWSANCGWISLSNADFYVQTTLSLIVSGPGIFTSVPGITNFYLMNRTNVVISGTNGQAGDAYYLLQSTNLTLPLKQWTTVGTDVLSATGPFTVTYTNAATGWPQQFYILSSTNYNP